MTEIPMKETSIVQIEETDSGPADVVGNFIEGYKHFWQAYRSENKDWPDGSIDIWSIEQVLMPSCYDNYGFVTEDGSIPDDSLAEQIMEEFYELAPKGLEVWAERKEPFLRADLIDDDREVLMIETAIRVIEEEQAKLSS
jgi:hypothetical protein